MEISKEQILFSGGVGRKKKLKGNSVFQVFPALNKV